MNQKELEFYKSLLLEERQNVLTELMEDDESARDLLENDLHNVNDSVDEASSTVAQTLLTIMNKNSQQKMLAIEAALRRIVENAYGICISCGKAVAKDRLKAVPWATKCIDCKIKDEKKH